jgi:hypothetical protein
LFLELYPRAFISPAQFFDAQPSTAASFEGGSDPRKTCNESGFAPQTQQKTARGNAAADVRRSATGS